MTDAALFSEEDATGPHRPGRVETGTARSIKAGYDAGRLIEEDAGMAEGALLAARTLDRAERLPDKSAVYAVAQLMRPWQDAMHALRLPAEVSPASAPARTAEPAPDSQQDMPDWLRDAFGTAE